MGKEGSSSVAQGRRKRTSTTASISPTRGTLSHVCTLILPPSTSTSTSHAQAHPDGFGEVAANQSNLEATFIRQNSMKGKSYYSATGSLTSMISNPSSGGMSMGTSRTASSAELKPTSGSSLKRVTSMTSVTSNTSQQQQKQKHPHPYHPSSSSQSQSNSQNTPTSSSSYYTYPTSSSSFAVSSNPHAGSLMKIAFGQFLLVPTSTSDGRIHIYNILDYRHAEHCVQGNEINLHAFHRTESRYKNIANNRVMTKNIQKAKEAVQPICSLGPFYVGDYEYEYRPTASASSRKLTSTNTSASTNTSTNANSDKKHHQVKASIADFCVCEYKHGKMTSHQHQSEIGSFIWGNVAILTQEGDVHVFQFHSIGIDNGIGVNVGVGSDSDLNNNMNSTSINPNLNNQLKVDHLVSYFSGNFSATSISIAMPLRKEFGVNVNANVNLRADVNEEKSTTTTSPRRNQSESSSTSGEMIIAVGCDNGIISEHIITNNCVVILRWRGTLENTVGSLVYIQRSHQEGESAMDTLVDQDDEKQDRGRDMDSQLYLVVGISQNDRSMHESEENACISCIDVINTSVVQRVFGSLSSSSSSSSSTVGLKEYSIWPSLAIIRGEGALSQSGSGQLKTASSHNKLSYAMISVVDIFIGSQQTFTALLSNGLVITLEYWFDKANGLHWGVRRQNHGSDRVFQSFSGCGIGVFYCSSSLYDDGDDSIACCTRGGAIYTFPIKTSFASSPVTATSRSSSDRITNTTTLYSLPLDNGVDDGVARYIQGFTAGYIRVRTWGVRSNSEQAWNTVPLFLVALPGGAIDCYTCSCDDAQFQFHHLAKSNTDNSIFISHPKRYEILLLQLLSNGALEQLLRLLSSVDNSNKTELLKKASEEFQRHRIHPNELVTRIVRRDMDGFQHLCQLIEDLIVGRHTNII